MKKQNNYTLLQLVFFIIQTQIGVGVLGLPFNVYGVSKQDAWISILLSGVIIQVIITTLWILGRRFPSKTIFEYSKQLAGKIVGTAINLSYVCYGLMVTCLILMYSTSIIKTWVLVLTPKWIIMLLLIITAILLAKEKLMDICNVYVVVSGFILLLCLISILVVITYPVEWRYLLPIGQSGGMKIIKGVKEVYFSMLGFELLVILFPYFQHHGDRSILLSASVANIIVTFVYTFLTIVSIVTFSPEELTIVPEPVLYYVKSLYLQIVERVDLVFVSLWVVSVITSLTSYLFVATEGCSFIFKRFKRSYFTLFIGSAAYAIALFPKKEADMDIFNKVVLNISYLFVLIFPLFLLGISLIFKKNERRKDA